MAQVAVVTDSTVSLPGTDAASGRGALGAVDA